MLWLFWILDPPYFRCALSSTVRSRSLTQRQSAVARYCKIGEAFNLLKTKNMIYKCQTQRREKKLQNISNFQQKTDCESRWEEDGYGGKKWVEVGTISFVFIHSYFSRAEYNTVFQSHREPLWFVCTVGLSKSVSEWGISDTWPNLHFFHHIKA